MVMHKVPTSIREDDYQYSAYRYLRGWLWIECQQVYERVLMTRVPTSIWEDGYE